MLREVASETGCALGCYFILCDGAHETFRATYIHSKLMIVDDEFLTIGSANLTNRSMGLDSELHRHVGARERSRPARRRHPHVK